MSVIEKLEELHTEAIKETDSLDKSTLDWRLKRQFRDGLGVAAFEAKKHPQITAREKARKVAKRLGAREGEFVLFHPARAVWVYCDRLGDIKESQTIGGEGEYGEHDYATVTPEEIPFAYYPVLPEKGETDARHHQNS